MKLMITSEGRQCTVCRVFKQWDQFHFDASKKTGYRAQCKDCYAAHIEKEFDADATPKGHTKIMKEGRVCIVCGKLKPWTSFHVDEWSRTTKHKARCRICSKKPSRPLRITAEGRECSVCGLYKAWEEFHAMAASPTKHRSSCKDCRLTLRRMRAEMSEDADTPPKTQEPNTEPQEDVKTPPSQIQEPDTGPQEDMNPSSLIPEVRGVTETGRKCSICGVWKTWSEFHKDKYNRYLHYPQCKTCRTARRTKRPGDSNLLANSQPKRKPLLLYGRRPIVTYETLHQHH